MWMAWCGVWTPRSWQPGPKAGRGHPVAGRLEGWTLAWPASPCKCASQPPPPGRIASALHSTEASVGLNLGCAACPLLVYVNTRHLSALKCK